MLRASPYAQVAELVDALASGASDLTVVEVQVLSWAPQSSQPLAGQGSFTSLSIFLPWSHTSVVHRSEASHGESSIFGS